MRKVNRILKIIKLDFPKISYISNSGEYMVLNIKELFKKINIKKSDFGYEILTDKDIFKSVILIDNALAWENVVNQIQLPNDKIFETYFHLDPIVSIENSIRDESIILGQQLKELRKRQHLSQDQLGKLSGTTKHYISKLENNKTDPEFKTLRKIYEVGLNKNFIIAHYDGDDLLKGISNSVFKTKFLDWAESNKENLELIEGVGKKIKVMFYNQNIKTTKDLAHIRLSDLMGIIPDKSKLNIYHHSHSWITQAKCIDSSDWLNVIKMQRILQTGESKEVYSKIEDLAKKELRDDIFIVK